MIGGRTTEEVRRYDLGKACVAIALIGLWIAAAARFDSGHSAGDHGGNHGGDHAVAEKGHDDKSHGEGGPAVDVPATFTLDAPAIGSELTPGMLKFSGTAPSGAKVMLLGDGAQMAQGVAGDDAKWAFDLNLAPPYPEKWAIIVSGAEGGEVGRNDDLGFTIKAGDMAAATKFTVARPIDQGVVAVGDWTIAGTAKPGHKVLLKMDKWPLGTATADASGTWKFPRNIKQAGPARKLVATEMIDGKAGETITHTISVIQ